MPKTNNLPKTLRPYVFHGVSIDYTEGSGKEDITGLCPFCGREKFSVNVESGLWRCLVCNAGTNNGKVLRGGNVYTFLRLFHQLGLDLTIRDRSRYVDLAANRSLLSPDTLHRWGICPSPTLKDDWLVPGYSPDGKLNQLYRYSTTRSSDGTAKCILLATPDLSHCLYGIPLLSPRKARVFICEGPWDAMCLEEVLRIATRTGDKEGTLALTGNEQASLYHTSNILAVPGCGTFLETWLSLFAGKDVVILYDNDHPKVVCKECRKGYSEFMHKVCPNCQSSETTGQTLPPPALTGTKCLSAMLSIAEEPPASICYLSWGIEGYNTDLPSGYDVRDWLYEGGEDERGRVELLQDLLALIQPIPTSWVAGRSEKAAPSGTDKECKPCRDWETLIAAWRKAMYWTDGLDRGLSFALSIVTSTLAIGDQLWGKMIGPASCGKSTLCEALSVNRQYILPKSTIRGFHSGMRAAGGAEEDLSLIVRARDKTLVTKDGDALLQQPNLSQILAEARDIYDRVSRSHYRNGMGQDYSGINMTWLICGTPSLRVLDSSELGERFLDCVIMDEMDEDLELAILRRVADKAHRNMSYEANGKLESQHDPELVHAMQLTGGYVTYLRTNAQRLLDGVSIPQEMKDRCIRLGMFTAFLRARPSKTQVEEQQKEFGARLVSQMIRLAQCTAVVLGRKVADEEVMRRVRRVALDTSRGVTMDMARHLFREGEHGVEAGTLAIWMGQQEKDTRALLCFLASRDVGAVRTFVRPAVIGYGGKSVWGLTNRLYKLYAEVIGS